MQYVDVDTAVTLPVNAVPLTDDTDFKTTEEAIAYNAAGMDLEWHFVTSAGVYTVTAVTPTTAGDYDWTHKGNGMYQIEIPASGGASINNDTEGYGWFVGQVDGVLDFRSPTYGFRAAAVNDALCDGGDLLDVNATQISGSSTAADNAETVYDTDFATNYDASNDRWSVGVVSIGNNVVTAASLATDAVTEIQSGLLTSTAFTNALPTNFADLAITATTGRVTVGTNSDKTGYSLTNLTVQASTTLATGTHEPQSGDSFSYLGTNLGLLGANATEAGGDGDHLTEAGGTGDHLTALATEAVQTLLDYDNAIWVDPIFGTDDATDGSYGKRSAPCKTWANVASLLIARSLNKVRVVGSGTLAISGATIASNLSIACDPGCTVSIASTSTTAAITIRGGSVTVSSLTVGVGGGLYVYDAMNIAGTITGSGGGAVHIYRSRLSAVTVDTVASLNVVECNTFHSGAGWSTITIPSVGHCSIVDWLGGGLILDPTGSHIHFSGTCEDLTINGSSGSVTLTGDVVIASESANVTVDKTGVTAKEGADGDTLETLSDQLDGVATPAQVNAQVVDALATDTYAEPGQGAPAATTSLAAKINYLYKAWRNKRTQTSSELVIFSDDGTTEDHAATVSDDGTTTTVGEMGTGA